MAEDTGWEPPDDFDPLEAIIRGLDAKAEGQPYNEEELTFATMALGVMSLIVKGLDEDDAIAIIESAMRHGQIRITWEDGQLSVSIGKLEDEVPEELDSPLVEGAPKFGLRPNLPFPK